MYLKFTHFPDNSEKCWFFHCWKTVVKNDFTKYQKCSKCNSRRVIQKSDGGYKEVDFKWVKFEHEVPHF